MTDVTTSGTNRSSAGASDMKEELSGDAQRLKDTAKQRAQQEAGTRKRQATGAARSASSALEKAAGELRNDDSAPSWLTSAFEKTAREVDNLAGSVEGKDVGQIRREVTNFARQSPTAFLAASAAAGFAAARFLRAGSEYQSHHDSAQDSGGRGTGQGAWSNDSSLSANTRQGATL